MFVFLVIIAVIIFLIVRKNPHKENPTNRHEKRINPAKETSSNVSPTVSVPPASRPAINKQMSPVVQNGVPEKKYNTLPNYCLEYVAAYRYTEVGIFVPDDAIFDVEGFEPGSTPALIQEPNNPYDNRAVGLMLNERIVGYLYRGKLQDMANDWLTKKKPVRAQITACIRDKQRAEITLVFYDLSRYEKYLAKYPNARKYRLTGNTREEMQDNISLCSSGDECSIDYDFEKDKYLVSSGADIGYLPASAAKRIEEDGEDAYNIFVADTDYDDRGKNIISVYLFPTGK